MCWDLLGSSLKAIKATLGDTVHMADSPATNMFDILI
jgi:hypothetical protein